MEGSVRYGEDTGQVLWSGPFTGSAAGVPVSYESKGRQFVVMIATRGGGGGATAPASGMIAFALPKN